MKTPPILQATTARILKEEFLEPLNLTQAELSRRSGIPRSTLNEILMEKRPINAETAFRLGLCFGTSPIFWLNLQTRHELMLVEHAQGEQIRSQVAPCELVSA